jgi:hypothetical protein
MAKKRITVPLQIMKQLMGECFGKCSVPNCYVTTNLEIHHIDGDPSNNKSANLIVLCPNHHSDADKGIISINQCRRYKRMLPNISKYILPLIKILSKSSSPSGFRYGPTEEGPAIFGKETLLSASECNALLDRYIKYLPHFIRKQKRRMTQEKDIFGAANFLTVLRAFGETYNRMPSEEEIETCRTELAQKLDLFYRLVLMWSRDLFKKCRG